MAAQDDLPGGAARSLMAALAEAPSAPNARRPMRWGLLAWWLLPLLYLAWLLHNAAPLLPRLTQTPPGALLGQLIALPSLPALAGVALPS